jgi:predicted HD superfamily hydrolase involved in NAD metabolism
LSASFAQLSRGVRDAIGQQHRYAHSVRVARLAERLAAAHGEDTARARTAGMLHDLARLWDAKRLVRECETRAMPIDAFERETPIVLHARLGAELARENFGVDDPTILSAIAHHTVGARAMSRLDAIVYLADALEPGRDYPERASLERLAFANLDDAMVAVIRSSFAYLRGRNLPIAPQTLEALAHFESLASQSPSTRIPGYAVPISKEHICRI